MTGLDLLKRQLRRASLAGTLPMKGNPWWRRTAGKPPLGSAID